MRYPLTKVPFCRRPGPSQPPEQSLLVNLEEGECVSNHHCGENVNILTLGQEAFSVSGFIA